MKTMKGNPMKGNPMKGTIMKRSISMLFLMLIALVAGQAQARPGGGHGKRGGKHRGKIMSPKHFDRLAEELNVDPKMREALRAQLEAARAQGKEKKQALRAEHEKLKALLQADAPDRAAVMAQIDRIGALRLAMHKLKVGTMIDLRAALSPEQRAQLKAKMEARRKRRHKRGRRGRRGKRSEPGFEPPMDEE